MFGKVLDEVSWDFDHCDRICHKLIFMGKSIIQITTFFGYTLKCCWLFWGWGLVSQSDWIWIFFLNPQSERLSKGPKLKSIKLTGIADSEIMSYEFRCLQEHMIEICMVFFIGC